MPTKSFILAAFLAVSYTFNLFAQLENTKWYFGVNNGINFTPNGALSLSVPTLMLRLLEQKAGRLQPIQLPET